MARANKIQVTEKQVRDLLRNARERAGLEPLVGETLGSDVQAREKLEELVVKKLSLAFRHNGAEIMDFHKPDGSVEKTIFFYDDRDYARERRGLAPNEFRTRPKGVSTHRREFIESFTPADAPLFRELPCSKLFGPTEEAGASIGRQIITRLLTSEEVGVGRKLTADQEREKYLEDRTRRKWGPGSI